MPPKRKHTDDNSKETTRSTRSSTRNKATVAKTGAAESAPSKTTSKRSARGSLAGNREEDHEDSVEKQPAKRARTTKAVGRGKKQTKSSATMCVTLPDRSKTPINSANVVFVRAEFNCTTPATFHRFRIERATPKQKR
ncbi:hypothetical protein P691DRAFT_594281 [Macrolepiota fuliginosa MF-IS2]|uniref:Uncharacterized protein n=1 Tax=Macrolepiota fuliginosa MF-IS2 TaxID=1400762 RepID=A0A9P5XCL5_9AGAR|nr:hypothetical protein P691DRAFT_594281 [Macrolepiota fuliginosa MF-IS2]